ncbi:unnamed protein product [Staurois parvus]|uniref:Uncharacterized protein n=1 Tax=Staurois parvus TaxID=386267 RepID=A0ABN9F0Z5_9NEOB|nr:unnamed protein product [Staurois parvus]
MVDTEWRPVEGLAERMGDTEWRTSGGIGREGWWTLSGGQWRDWQRGVEDTEWRPLEGLAGGMVDTEWRPLEGLAERDGGH